MKFNRFVIACATLLSAGSALAAGGETTGQIKFEGELVTTACGLSANSSPVNVNFYQVPISQLKNGGIATVEKNIELQYCDTTTAKSAVVTYTPTSISTADPSLAAFTPGSTAKGAGIGLYDSTNKIVDWNTKTTPVTLKDGTTKIPFIAFLRAEAKKGAKDDDPVTYSTPTAGTFFSTINFVIAYQ